MPNDENNLGMSGESGVNEAPMSDEATGGAPTEGEDQAGEGQEITLDEFNELKAKAAKTDENWDKYVRAVAELDNFRKRAARERTDAVKYANAGLIEKLLPVVDSFEAALAAANTTQGDNLDSLKTGIQMIFTQLKNFLTEAGVDEIDAMDQPFDPNLHEAVSQQATDDVPEGQVVQQMRKGYRLKDRLIRPAMVVVAKKP